MCFSCGCVSIASKRMSRAPLTSLQFSYLMTLTRSLRTLCMTAGLWRYLLPATRTCLSSVSPEMTRAGMWCLLLASVCVLYSPRNSRGLSSLSRISISERESRSVPGGQAGDGTDTSSVRSGSGQVGAGDVEGLEGGEGGDQSLQEHGGVSQVSPGLGTLRHVQMTQLLQLTDGLQRFLHICQHIKMTFSASVPLQAPPRTLWRVRERSLGRLSSQTKCDMPCRWNAPVRSRCVSSAMCRVKRVSG